MIVLEHIFVRSGYSVWSSTARHKLLYSENSDKFFFKVHTTYFMVRNRKLDLNETQLENSKVTVRFCT
jgi:hypothetical protein